MVEVRPAGPADDSFLRQSLIGAFGAAEVVAHDELIEATVLPAGIAWQGEERVGHVTYRADPAGGWEVVSIVADRAGQGIGAALLDWVRARAERAGMSRVWLITTNDNTHALRFY